MSWNLSVTSPNEICLCIICLCLYEICLWSMSHAGESCLRNLSAKSVCEISQLNLSVKPVYEFWLMKSVCEIWQWNLSSKSLWEIVCDFSAFISLYLFTFLSFMRHDSIKSKALITPRFQRLVNTKHAWLIPKYFHINFLIFF